MTYTRLYEGRLVTLPGVAATKCDFCHQVTYDYATLQRIDALLQQSKHPISKRNARSKPLVAGKQGAYGIKGKP